MIQVKVTFTKEGEFILGNVSKTWNKALKEEEARAEVFLHSGVDGAEHAPACSRPEGLKTILLLGSPRGGNYRQYSRTAPKQQSWD